MRPAAAKSSLGAFHKACTPSRFRIERRCEPSFEMCEARALTEPAKQQWPIAIAERSPTGLEFSELWRVPVSYEGSLVEARPGVGHAFDHHAPLGRITKAAEAHCIILFGVVLLGAIRCSSQKDPLDGLNYDVGSLFNRAGPVASK